MHYLDTFTRSGIRLSIRPNGKLKLTPAWLVKNELLVLANDVKDELVAEIRNCRSTVTDAKGNVSPDYHLLMVATNLDSWEADDPRFGYEVMLDTCYRQLDAQYYAWLRHRMENASKAHKAGTLDDAAFDVMRERFNEIHMWAVRHIGEDVLKRAVRTTNVKTYVPPSPETFAAYRKIWDNAWDACKDRQASQGRSGNSGQSTPSDPASRLNHALATRGYAVIHSKVIGDHVVFVRDDSVAVPDKWAGKVRYTLEELSLMLGSVPEAVKQIHEVKRIFGGKVVPQDESDADLFADESAADAPRPNTVATNSHTRRRINRPGIQPQLSLLGAAR